MTYIKSIRIYSCIFFFACFISRQLSIIEFCFNVYSPLSKVYFFFLFFFSYILHNINNMLCVSKLGKMLMILGPNICCFLFFSLQIFNLCLVLFLCQFKASSFESFYVMFIHILGYKDIKVI